MSGMCFRGCSGAVDVGVVEDVKHFCYLGVVLDCRGCRKGNNGLSCCCMEKMEGNIKSLGVFH